MPSTTGWFSTPRTSFWALATSHFSINGSQRRSPKGRRSRATPAEIDALQWNGERLFQAAKFGTEMQYQHLVFEEFARKVQPNVDAFLMYDATIDPAIVAEFAHTVYRFGHSMLTETVDRFDPELRLNRYRLGRGLPQPAGVRQRRRASPQSKRPAPSCAAPRARLGNEIDEFVTEALRNNLLGLPLDLATINLARGRETGVPTLNAARAEFYGGTGDSQLKPYESWADFAANLKHPESIINFIAAYGTHGELVAADVDTFAEKRAVATALVMGGSAIINAGDVGGTERTFTADDPDRLDFLNATGVYAGGYLGGVNDRRPVDRRLGRAADAVRRSAGLDLQFRVRDATRSAAEWRPLLLPGAPGWPQLPLRTGEQLVRQADHGEHRRHAPSGRCVLDTGLHSRGESRSCNSPVIGDGNDDPTEGGTDLRPLVIRDNPATEGPDANYLEYTGVDHVVLGGTAGDDILIASIGDDTLWGDAGNDRLDGGDGVDNVEGGAGDDIITDLGGDDILKGNDGNDVIHGGNGLNLIIGGPGNDFIITGEDVSETFGGPGNDFILGAKTDAFPTW